MNGVEQSSAQTLDACRQKCLTISGCNAIDYNDNGVGVKCWTFVNLQNAQLVPETGVVHETLERCTTGKFTLTIRSFLYINDY
ncbi:hypothetical protein LSH36_2297g00000 [Paralvinella palmiformis]|uniref:Apple domain-containing protein n=1 Tax=Paralvinella palmiformis TaxID=53620 RepID=A0AAD9MPF4_9ANNE|nr:hypothetical protein LSH36_2297g00000 [Paralvinella palmiformis]